MSNANIGVMRGFPRSDWAQLLAYAWTESQYPEVLIGLRQDPKGTIIELAKETDSKYQNVDEATQQAAKSIQDQADTSPGEDYSGYLAIPDAVANIDKLDQHDLEVLLRRGITGMLRFDLKADVWADVLLKAWNDSTLLTNIRKDPLAYLPRRDELLKDEFYKYGIFPLPDRPRGLDKLEINKLESFLSDKDNVPHLSGIFLIAS